VNRTRTPRSFRRLRRSALATATSLIALTIGWIGAPTPVAHATTSPITIVTIGFDDGTADQFATLPVLQAHGMNATFFINTGPILAGDPGHMTVAQLTDLAGAGNEITGHTVDHANIQPLSTAEARAEVCTDRNTLIGWGFQPTSFAYPFGSYDAASEAVVQACGYNSGRTVSGVSIHVAKNKIGETVPPVDPYATRTPPNPKKATKLKTMEQYVLNAEAGVQANGQTLWIQFVFHRYCDAHCGAYTVQPAKFTALLDFLQAEVAAGRVSVQTTAQVIGGPVNPPVTP
jgi:peptidoglycan/xylan/chitin deacetylase (PgdA/CDA1 family)